MNNDSDALPLVGSIQNSIGMGFSGNQAAAAIAHALGARIVYAQSQFANARGGFPGRTTTTADPAQFRRDCSFVVAQRPGIIHVGFLPKPEHVDVLASVLRDYKGIVLLDPVIGDHTKGLFVSEETARAIREWLVPMAQIVTPNRFEAEVLLGVPADSLSEFGYLNGIYDLGPQAVVITSFERDTQRGHVSSLFTNGYGYYRIGSPYFHSHHAYGVGDIFAAGVASFVALGGSPFAAALLATALTARAAANASSYGGGSADPVTALTKWNPHGYQSEDERAMRFCERSDVVAEQIKPHAEDGVRLKFAPPKNQITYG